MFFRYCGQRIIYSFAILGASASSPALALTMEQAIASCKQGIGSQIVRSCMMAAGGSASRESARASRVAKATPAVRACVAQALNKANGRANVAIGAGDGKKKEAVNLDRALPAGFVPPPRAITDITAVLDNEKPDPGSIARLKAEADANPDKLSSSTDLASFYYARGNTRSLLGRVDEAIADGQKVLGFARAGGDQMLFHRAENFIGTQQQALGDLKSTLRTYREMMQGSNTPKMDLWHIIAIPSVMQAHIQAGDLQQAEGLQRRMSALITKVRTSGIPGHREQYRVKGRFFEGFHNESQALLLEARGQYQDAERAYTRASEYHRSAIPGLAKFDDSPPPAQVLQKADSLLLNAARMKAKQGRLAEQKLTLVQPCWGG